MLPYAFVFEAFSHQGQAIDDAALDRMRRRVVQGTWERVVDPVLGAAFRWSDGFRNILSWFLPGTDSEAVEVQYSATAFSDTTPGCVPPDATVIATILESVLISGADEASA